MTIGCTYEFRQTVAVFPNSAATSRIATASIPLRGRSRVAPGPNSARTIAARRSSAPRYENPWH